MKLAYQHKLSLKPVAPFNFNATVHKPSHFPAPVEYYEQGRYLFSLRLRSQIIGVEMINRGSTEKPAIDLALYAKSSLKPADLSDIRQAVTGRFDLESDLSEFYNGFAKDKILAPISKKYRGARAASSGSLYEFLIITILLQNTVVKRTVQMMDNLLQKYGTQIEFAGKKIYVIWPPEKMTEVSEQDLRDLKLGYRAKTIKRMSEDFIGKPIQEDKLRKLGRDDCKKELLKIYGVGKQSVWYLLFEHFHHYDAFETVSPWEQKIYSRLLFGKDIVSPEKILKEVDKRWGQYKMLASHLIFEDIFWQRKQGKALPWLEKEIRL